jgi:hypothetical protein
MATALRSTDGAANASPEPLQSYRTKNTPVTHLHFTPRNLLLAAGTFRNASS